MTAEQALRKSYEHWLENWECSLTGKGTGAGDCALCVHNTDKDGVTNCHTCVLHIYGFGCMHYHVQYREISASKPTTVGDMAMLLLLIYLSEYGTDPDGGC